MHERCVRGARCVWCGDTKEWNAVLQAMLMCAVADHQRTVCAGVSAEFWHEPNNRSVILPV